MLKFGIFNVTLSQRTLLYRLSVIETHTFSWVIFRMKSNVENFTHLEWAERLMGHFGFNQKLSRYSPW